METVKIFSLLDKFGLEIFALALIVCAIMYAIKKLHFNLTDKQELALRLIVSAIVYAIYLWITKQTFETYLEQAVLVGGTSLIVCNFIKKGKIENPTTEILTAFLGEETAKTLTKPLEQATTEDEIKAELYNLSKDGLTDNEIEMIANMIYELKKLN